MKKYVLLGLALVMCLLVLASCGSTADSKPKLVLGFDADYPPFGYLDSATGNYVGFDIEYAQAVCDDLGYELVLKPIDWNAKDEQLSTGAIDFIWNGFTYEERENDYAWTARYLDSSIVIMTFDASIRSAADLAGKTVAAQSDSSGETALNKNAELCATFKNGRYEIEAEYTTAYSKLEAGAYDAIVVDVGVANYLKSKHDTVLIAAEPLTTETYGVGFRKTDTELCAKIEASMIKIAKNTEFIQGLCTKYGVDYNAFLLK